jgi:hypothetical protein
MRDRQRLVMSLIKTGVDLINSYNEEHGFTERLKFERLPMADDSDDCYAILGDDFEIYADTQFGEVKYSNLTTIDGVPAGAAWFLTDLERVNSDLFDLLWLADVWTFYAGVDGVEF